ncbi:MAG: hypothetical protein HZA19_03095 [Nitrospirae bacterium]|nr:hypothetical protein [Nitrospirota bacterium]
MKQNQMKRMMTWAVGIFVVFGLTALSPAEEMSKSPIKNMSKDQLIKLAMSAAPENIAKDATILLPGEDGKLMEVKKGTNGFTCIPDIDGQEKPDPICADEASMQWVNDLMSNAPKPTNMKPGIAYMAQGGWHFEKDGKILMKPEPGSTRMEEPPHWMVFWPFDSKASGMPSLPNKWGAYVMWDGTPYAHLMIYQDPNHMRMGMGQMRNMDMMGH